MRAPRIYLVAAEASGDRLGAGLMRSLRERRADITFGGIGGALMAQEGIQTPFDIAELSVLGFVEGLKAYPRVKRRVSDALIEIIKFDPDCVILIDSWGYTLRVAQALKRAGSKARIVKYLGPQVWASRPGRAKTLAKYADHLLCMHAFEPQYYAPYDLPCTVVGNPVANDSVRFGDAAAFRSTYGIASDAPILLLLFGSRPSEVARLGADFMETAKKLRNRFPKLVVVTFAAATVRESVIEVLSALPNVLVIMDERQKEDTFSAATVALACSGSVTTELALQKTPMVVGYKLGALTYFLAKNFLFKPRYITMLNITADQEIVKEFIQNACTPANLIPALSELLCAPDSRTVQVESQNAALVLMGKGKASAADVAADAVLDQLATL